MILTSHGNAVKKKNVQKRSINHVEILNDSRCLWKKAPPKLHNTRILNLVYAWNFPLFCNLLIFLVKENRHFPKWGAKNPVQRREKVHSMCKKSTFTQKGGKSLVTYYEATFSSVCFYLVLESEASDVEKLQCMNSDPLYTIHFPIKAFSDEKLKGTKKTRSYWFSFRLCSLICAFEMFLIWLEQILKEFRFIEQLCLSFGWNNKGTLIYIAQWLALVGKTISIRLHE